MPFGMNIEVPAPAQLPRPWATALTTYAALGYGADDKGVQRWLNGVKFMPFGCDKIVGQTFDPCVARTTDYNDGIGTAVSFDPFLAEVAVECSTLVSDGPELEAYLLLHSEVSRSSILGAQVEHSAFTTTNPSLASEAQTITNPDQSLMGAIIAVEDALADLLDGGLGMIHMTAGLFVAFSAGGGVRWDVDNRPHTATGHLIVADAGYLGVSPATNAVAAGQKWIYGSGPVFAHYSATFNHATAPQTVKLSRNIRSVQVEQYGIAIFEPCSVVAAQVDTSDSDVIND